jgi:hypothetical protein
MWWLRALAATRRPVRIDRARAVAAMALVATVTCAPASDDSPGARSSTSGPSILFCAPDSTPIAGGWVDLTYLAELRESGFEVDFTEGLREVTWDRIRRFNVLVLATTPDGFAVERGERSSPERIRAFVELIERYLGEGGGVLLMPREGHSLKQLLADLTDPWGARLPVERIVEDDPDRRAAMTRMPDVPVAYTDRILPSPIGEGVRGIWYPTRRIVHGQMTGPLALDESWQVAVRASATSRTEPIDLSKQVNPPPLPEPFQRLDGVTSPPLVALRERKRGRIALISQWNQFSFGAGTKWLYDREILSKGFRDRPSDFGRLLENIFRWLAEPSLQERALGGFRTPAERLVPPNQRPGARASFDASRRREARSPDPTASWTVRRGLFGARTAYSSGTATVEEFAAAARAAGLAFLVFLEDFDQLSHDEFRALRRDCRAHSDASLELIPGFEIVSNIGNRVFHFGPDAEWPPPEVRTGPDRTLLDLQEEDAAGGFTGRMTPYHRWVLKFYGAWKRGGNVGYYDFADSGGGMKPWSLRNYSLLGLRTYRNGELVEDVTPEYLITAQSTIPPGPVSVNEVRSPEELRREITRGHALTYALAPAVGGISRSSLRWATQYHSLPIFVSDGPEILAWPRTVRVMTFGGEDFTSLWTAMPSLLHVRSRAGLKEIRLYDGARLFRRFRPGGAREFRETLVLDATVQRNLVPVVEDVDGGRAVGFARRSWKTGTGIVFCSDHINDCSDTAAANTVTMVHGPHQLPLAATPGLPSDVRGGTWDGGPTGTRAPVQLDSTPVLDSSEGTENGGRFEQIPLLEFTDEGARAVASEHDLLFSERVERVLNAWNTRGPLGGPSKLFRYTQRFRHWFRPSRAVPPSGWAAFGERLGAIPTLYVNEITFRSDLTIRSLRLAGARSTDAETPAILAVGDGRKPREIELSPSTRGAEPLRIEPGQWFGFFARGPANSHLFVNRGEPILLEPRRGWVLVFADARGRRAKRGEVYRNELFALGFPLDLAIDRAADFVPYLDYLAHPDGLEVRRGLRVESPGLLEVEPADHAVELVLAKPASGIDLVVPLRVRGLNPRWSTGVFLEQGYVLGGYGPGKNRYRAAGLDFAGDAYVPLHPAHAERTHVIVGQPIVADSEGRDLFIQVTKLAEAPFRWHVSVNNPTDRPIEATLRRAMDLPGLEFSRARMAFQPGEYRVLEGE